MAFLVIFLLIVLNGYFSLAEIALVTVKKDQLEQSQEQGNSSAKAALSLIVDPEGFLSAVQVGITLLGLLEGIYGGDLVATRLQPLFLKMGISVWLAHILSLVLGIGLITYLTIVIGELLPKSIALQAPLKVSLFIAPSLVLFSRIAYPFIKALTWSTRLLLQWLHIQSGKEEQVSEQEIKGMLRAAYQQGTLEQTELQLHQNIFSFTDLTAGRMMKPLPLTRLVNDTWTRDEIVALMQKYPYSHFPVFHQDHNNITSVLEVKSFFLGQQKTWQELTEPPLWLQEDVKGKDVFDRLKKEKKDFAIVRDEAGNAVGILTMQDVMEGVFGDIPELETYEDYFYQTAPNEWEAQGLIHLQRVRRILGMEWLRAYEEDSLSIKELLNTQLGHLPGRGEELQLNELTFKVLETDEDGASKVKLTIA